MATRRSRRRTLSDGLLVVHSAASNNTDRYCRWGATVATSNPRPKRSVGDRAAMPQSMGVGKTPGQRRRRGVYRCSRRGPASAAIRRHRSQVTRRRASWSTAACDAGAAAAALLAPRTAVSPARADDRRQQWGPRVAVGATSLRGGGRWPRVGATRQPAPSAMARLPATPPDAIRLRRRGNHGGGSRRRISRVYARRRRPLHWHEHDGATGRQHGRVSLCVRRCHGYGSGTGYVALAAGGFHACAATSASRAVIAGAKRLDGQLFRNSPTTAFLPFRADLSAPVGAVRAGWGASCGLLADTSVWCYGYAASGQLGNGLLVQTLALRFPVERPTCRWVSVMRARS